MALCHSSSSSFSSFSLSSLHFLPPSPLLLWTPGTSSFVPPLLQNPPSIAPPYPPWDRNIHLCWICIQKSMHKGEQTAKVNRRLHSWGHSLSRPAVQFGRCGQVFPLSRSPSTPSGQTAPLIFLQLALTDPTENNFKCVFVLERRNGSIFCSFVITLRSSGSYSKCASSVKKKLTACLCVSGACWALSASLYTSSAAQPSGHGVPLPLCPTHPEAVYCTAAKSGNEVRNTS